MSKPTVCVDLDGVLSDYSQGWKGVWTFGPPIPGAVEFLRRLSEKYRVVIYTCRCSEGMNGRNGLRGEQLSEIVREWLDKHGFSYDSIWAGQGKPVAVAYVDDRAVSCCPTTQGPNGRVKNINEIAYEDAIQRTHQLAKAAH